MTEMNPPRIAACVTLFHPGKDVENLLNRLRETYAALIVVDNGGGDELVLNGDLVVEKAPGNVGVSRALNLGLGCASDLGFEWVAYFDQDSGPTYSASTLEERVAKASPTTGIVSAQYVDRATGRVGYHGRRLHGPTLTPISAGSCFNVAVWREIGGFDEALDVDLIDTEFALRVQRAGFGIEIETDLELDHSVGAKTDHRVLGRNLTTTGHASWRLYTKLDATVHVLAKHARFFPRWSMNLLKIRIVETIVDLTLGTQQLPNAKMLCRWIFRRTPPEISRIRAGRTTDVERLAARS